MSIENVEELKAQNLDVLTCHSSLLKKKKMSLGQIIAGMMKQNGQETFTNKSEFYQVLLHKPSENNCQVDTEAQN